METPAGQEFQRIVDLLHADEDTSIQNWEDALHSSFTAEVSADGLVDLLRPDIRPATATSSTAASQTCASAAA